MQALDIDGDGELSSKEIENATAALKTLDKDKDGKLTGEELHPALAGRSPNLAAGDAQAFVAQLLTFDKNGDGKLARDELPERMLVLMDRADANKDGFVDKAELTTFADAASRRNPSSGGQGLGRPDGPGEFNPGPGGGGEPRRRRRAQTPPANPAE
jgi:Ca2+-binding EF-hand superfamily protein